MFCFFHCSQVPVISSRHCPQNGIPGVLFYSNQLHLHLLTWDIRLQQVCAVIHTVVLDDQHVAHCFRLADTTIQTADCSCTFSLTYCAAIDSARSTYENPLELTKSHCYLWQSPFHTTSAVHENWKFAQFLFFFLSLHQRPNAEDSRLAVHLRLVLKYSGRFLSWEQSVALSTLTASITGSTALGPGVESFQIWRGPGKESQEV